MREIAIRVPAACVETVLDELLPLAPNGIFDIERGEEVELRLRGRRDELPEPAAVLATAGPWLRWSGEREVPDDWTEQRRLDFEPLVIGGRVAVRPPWAPPPAADLVDVVLDDSRQAFGSGVHPTTRGCLEALLAKRVRGSLADLGCGTGVLAIAAAKLGFGPVAAVDHDPEAVAAARLNAADSGAAIDARRLDLCAEPAPKADVLVANVPAEVHVPLAKGLAARPRYMIASGVPADEADALVEAYACTGLRERARRSVGGWAVVELGRGAAGAGPGHATRS